MTRFETWVRALYQKEGFEPGLIGLLFNPYFIYRRRLLGCMKHYAGRLAGGRMLDLGCGSKPYRRFFDVKEYIGLDVEVSGHDHATSEIDVFYDGGTIPFDDAHFDSVLSTEVFEHLFALGDTVREINRVLKPGGSLLVSAPFFWPEHEVPYDYARYTSYGIADLLTRNGFEVVAHTRAGNSFETISQVLSAYLWHTVLPSPLAVKFLLTPFLVAPFNVLGIVLGWILPKDDTLFQGNVVLCRKIGR